MTRPLPSSAWGSTITPAPATQSQSASRTVRVFLSSTFRDMQAERDELMKRVFPRLRAICRLRGLTFQEVDLRWGITEQEAHDGRVVAICLNEIDNCRPYFIGLLGERYGWTPDAYSAALLSEYPWLHAHSGQSVTELEIHYGALAVPPASTHAFFYLRDPAYLHTLPSEVVRRDFAPESDVAQAKQQQLNANIVDSGYPVRIYRDPLHAGELIFADLVALIEQQFPRDSEQTALERERVAHENFANGLRRVYIGSQRLFDQLEEHVASNGPPLVLVGAPGVGKSALLATWLQQRQMGVAPGWQITASRWDGVRRLLRRLWLIGRRSRRAPDVVFAHFIGATTESNVWSALLQRLIATWETVFTIALPNRDKPGALCTTFASCLQAVAQQGRTLVVIDGLDQLEDREQALELGWLPTSIPANVRLILSTSDGPTLTELRRRGWLMVEVPPLTPPSRNWLINHYLRQFGKSLDERGCQPIVAAAPTGNPLYLRTLLDELRIFGRYEALFARIEYYLTARTPEELFTRLLARLEEDYEERRAGLVSESMKLLYGARQGLTENELLHLLGSDEAPLPSAIWSPLYLALQESLLPRSGVLTFAQRALRQAVEQRYLASEAAKRSVHQRLAAYFARQPLSPREIEELPWHLAATQDWPALYTILANPAYLQVAWYTRQWEIRSYWALLQQQNKMALLTAYAPVVQHPEAYQAMLWPVCMLLGDAGFRGEALLLCRHLAQWARTNRDVDQLQASLSKEAELLQQQGDLTQALTLVQEQEQLCRQLGNEAALAASLGNQGVLLRELGRREEAFAALQTEEHFCRQGNDGAGLSANQGNQGLLLLDAGDLVAAMHCFQQQEQLCRQLGDVIGLHISRSHQAIIHRRQGKLKQALQLQSEAISSFRHLGDRLALKDFLGSLAAIHQEQGDYDAALELLEEKEALCQALQLPTPQIQALLQKGELFATALKQPAYALHHCVLSALQLAKAHNLPALQRQIEERIVALRAVMEADG